MAIDLHTHTTASDGALSPRALVALARDNGLAAIAVTDHDTTAALDEASAAGRALGVEVIPGVEMSTDVDQGEVHILGFFIDHRDPDLQALLTKLRDARFGRARKMVDKLAQMGLPLDWQRVQRFAGDGSVGRPHVAKAMVERGYVPDIKSAFDRYISRNGPAYVERYKLTPEEAVRVVCRVRGLAVLAHPLEGRGSLHMAADLAIVGLAGIECYYTGYTPEETALIETTADKLGLARSGGSDFHGDGIAASAVLGQPAVPYAVLEALRARHGELYGALASRTS